MTRKRSRGARDVCAHLFEDDRVVDRSRRFQSDDSRPAFCRKDAQLCKQVLRAVRDAMQAECTDPELRELVLTAAAPAPRSSRIRIHVMAREGCEAAAHAALLRAEGFLRAAVAAAITRKRTPTLLFLVTSERSDDNDDR